MAKINSMLRKLYPHGHPNFLPITLSELKLHNDKNHDYTQGGRALGNFERVSAILALYPGFPAATPIGVAIVYLLKQFDALCWGLAKGIKHKVEGLEERVSDISIYAKIIKCILQEEKCKV